jgi:hypothetical protein
MLRFLAWQSESLMASRSSTGRKLELNRQASKVFFRNAGLTNRCVSRFFNL